jgi:hypothetical protein
MAESVVRRWRVSLVVSTHGEADSAAVEPTWPELSQSAIRNESLTIEDFDRTRQSWPRRVTE